MDRVIAVGAIAILATTACGSGQVEPTKSIRVYAASSLVKTFTELGKHFEATHPGYSVEFVFAGSSDLSTSLAEEVNADVFASGDPANMEVVTEAGAVSGMPVPFAANRLVIVTPVGNPRNLRSFTDLASPGVRVALCSAQSSCGSATQLVERRSGVQLQPETPATTPGHVLDEVTSGRADAGVVFMTDALAAGDKTSWFAFSGIEDAVTSWIAVLRGTKQQQAAQEFVQEVTGADGRQLLADDGFSEPPKKMVG